MDKKYKGKTPYTMRVGISLLLVFILMVGGSGCMFKSSEETVAPKMLKYLEKKYGETFTLADNNFMNANFAGTATSLMFHPESHPEWYVTVDYEPGEPFTDNYVAFLKMDEVKEYLTPYFEEIYGEDCRVFVREPSNATLPSSLNKDTEIETYLSVATVGINIFTAANPDTRDTDAKKMWDTKDFVDYNMVVGVCYLTPEGFASEEAINGTVTSDSPYLYWGIIHVYSYTRDGGYNEVDWREGSALSASTSQA